MKSCPIPNLLTLSVLAVLIQLGAQAAVIQNVAINAVSTEYLSGTDQRRATNTVNGVGLYGDIHTTSAAGAMWLSLPATPSTVVGQQFITYDLGSVHTINRMKVYNYNELQSGVNVLTRRGVKQADISVAGEDLVFSTNLPNQTLTRATGLFTNVADTIPMGVSARYVRFNVRTNYNTTEGDFRVGLSKVLFIDDSVPPTVKLATRAYSGRRVTVQFSESVLPSTATNVANYAITNGGNNITISNAVMGTYNDTVILSTSLMDSNLVTTLSAQNVKDASNIISIANTNITVDPELILWLKADAGVTTDGSGNVTQWNDQSGLSNTAISIVTPTLVPSAVNGQPAVHFDGTSQYMEVTHNQSLVAPRDITVYAVLSLDTLAAPGQGPISKAQVNIPASFDMQIVATTGKPSFVRGNGSGFTTLGTSGGALVINQYYIVAVVMSGTNVNHFLNGNFNGAVSTVVGPGDTGSPIRLGRRSDGAVNLRGNLVETMVFKGAVSDVERASIDAYLGTKYGISVIALAITSQPANATRLVGQNATFGVTAIAGSPNINYQWQKNNVNIAGATNSTYVTPPVVIGDNNATYRAIVSTSLGITNTSTAATLTVLADTQPPTIYSATRTTGSLSNILVVFSEPVTSVSALNAANYTLDNGAVVTGVAAGASGNQVVLTTSVMDTNTFYYLASHNVQDLNGNIAATAAAPVLPVGAALWVRADSGVFTNATGQATEADDQSTNRNNALQYGSPLLMPTLVPNAMNGQPTFRFDGASNYFQVASSPSIALTSDLTIYAVANFSDYAAGRHILGKTLVNQPAPYDFYVLNSTSVRLYRGNGTVNANVAGTAPPPAGENHVISVSMQGTAVSHYVDGAVKGTGTLSTTIADSGTPLRIGSRNDLFQFMKGDISEVMVFGSALSAADRRIVDSYLAIKYFPFTFAQQPADATKLEGQTADFTVVASQGGAAFRYQWQKNLVDISGATNATYTTPLLTQADSGTTFRVVVTIPGAGTTNSASATLTVLPDNESPTVASAGRKLWSHNEIVVIFSESVDPATATNAANYTVDNGVSISSVRMGDAPNKIILTTSTLSDGVAYSVTVANVKDLYNNTIVTATVPSGLYPPSLALWLKADAGVIADGSGLVSEWDDQSGNGNHVSQTGGTEFMPLLVPAGINAKPTIRFDPNSTGATNFLIAASSPTLAITGDLTLYAVAKFPDYAQQREILGKTTANRPASFDWYINTTPSNPLYRGNGTVNAFVNAQTIPSVNQPHLMAVTMQGTTVRHYLDTITNGVGTLNTTLGDNGDALGIGIRSDITNHLRGDLSEIMILSSAVSDADRAAIDSYLAVKYSILAGAPPKLTITTGAGNNVVLSWPTPNLPFALESKSDLAQVSWAPVTDPVVISGATSSVTITNSVGQKFYRLREQ
jgi:hypothetical protein